jgi:hypothetical protein
LPRWNEYTSEQLMEMSVEAGVIGPIHGGRTLREIYRETE